MRRLAVWTANLLLAAPFLSFKVVRTHDVAWAKALFVASSLVLLGRVLYLVLSSEKRRKFRELNAEGQREFIWAKDPERLLFHKAARVLAVLGFICWCLFL